MRTKMNHRQKTKKKLRGGISEDSENTNSEFAACDSQGLGITRSKYNMYDNFVEQSARIKDEEDIIIEYEEPKEDTTLTLETTMNDLVNPSIKKTEKICDASSLHDMVSNIRKMELDLCNINENYDQLLKDIKASLQGTSSLQRTHTLNEWYENFKKIFIWQLYNESDLKQGIRLSMIGNEHNRTIDRLTKTYVYKIISGYFTKASICHAIYNLDKLPSRYTYLENTIQLLSCGVTNINNELYTQSNHIYDKNEGYLISGGNIFFVFAGYLCYLNEYVTTKHSMLNAITNDLNTREKDLFSTIRELFENDIFTASIKSILSSPSDMDFLFFSEKEDIEPSYTNALSASVLRSLLKKAFEGQSGGGKKQKSIHKSMKKSKSFKKTKKKLTKTKIKKTRVRPKLNPIHLFPFINQYDEAQWGKGKMFNLASGEDLSKCDVYGKMDQYTGYRQSCSYIEELPIYLNRIKQGYFPFTNLTKPDGSKCMDICREKELMTKYGECIDLSIGFTSNPLYKKKYDKYIEKNYYSIENLLGELEIILGTKSDDKSEKRTQRLHFLNILKTTNEKMFDTILKTIFKHIHFSGYGYNDTI